MHFNTKSLQKSEHIICYMYLYIMSVTQKKTKRFLILNPEELVHVKYSQTNMNHDTLLTKQLWNHLKNPPCHDGFRTLEVFWYLAPQALLGCLPSLVHVAQMFKLIITVELLVKTYLEYVIQIYINYIHAEKQRVSLHFQNNLDSKKKLVVIQMCLLP